MILRFCFFSLFVINKWLQIWWINYLILLEEAVTLNVLWSAMGGHLLWQLHHSGTAFAWLGSTAQIEMGGVLLDPYLKLNFIYTYTRLRTGTSTYLRAWFWFTSKSVLPLPSQVPLDVVTHNFKCFKECLFCSIWVKLSPVNLVWFSLCVTSSDVSVSPGFLLQGGEF